MSQGMHTDQSSTHFITDDQSFTRWVVEEQHQLTADPAITNLLAVSPAVPVHNEASSHAQVVALIDATTRTLFSLSAHPLFGSSPPTTP